MIPATALSLGHIESSVFSSFFLLYWLFYNPRFISYHRSTISTGLTTCICGCMCVSRYVTRMVRTGGFIILFFPSLCPCLCLCPFCPSSPSSSSLIVPPFSCRTRPGACKDQKGKEKTRDKRHGRPWDRLFFLVHVCFCSERGLRRVCIFLRCEKTSE